MEHKGKLELTWVGKYDDKVLEPRILVEDREKSYGDPRSENMLIHGDNLIALQALQQDFYGSIKCIYIEIIMQSMIQCQGKIKKYAFAV